MYEVSRKATFVTRELLGKQKEGKKKVRQFGRVEAPQEAFIVGLKMED